MAKSINEILEEANLGRKVVGEDFYKTVEEIIDSFEQCSKLEDDKIYYSFLKISQINFDLLNDYIERLYFHSFKDYYSGKSKRDIHLLAINKFLEIIPKLNNFLTSASFQVLSPIIQMILKKDKLEGISFNIGSLAYLKAFFTSDFSANEIDGYHVGYELLMEKIQLIAKIKRSMDLLISFSNFLKVMLSNDDFNFLNSDHKLLFKNDNPLPTIFKDKLAFDFFNYLLKDSTFRKETGDISFLQSRMRSEGLIISDKQKTFFEWFNNEYGLELSRKYVKNISLTKRLPAYQEKKYSFYSK